jgi:hypothetical protein
MVKTCVKSGVFFLAIWLAGSTGAAAQEANGIPKECSRSQNRSVIAGVDTDVQRCVEAFSRALHLRDMQYIMQGEDLLAKSQAELTFAKNDLDVAARNQAELAKRRDELEKMCAGVPDCAKLLKPEESNDEHK